MAHTVTPAPDTVTPAKAGVQKTPGTESVAGGQHYWIPAFAGMTGEGRNDGGVQKEQYMKEPCVYIMASQRNGTLYVGVTSDLVQRVWQHKDGVFDGFTKRYKVHLLVWYELHDTMENAILREKALKEWRRRWKLELIERDNPGWKDLYETLW